CGTATLICEDNRTLFDISSPNFTKLNYAVASFLIRELCFCLQNPGKSALPVTWVRGIKLRLFAFSSVAASHDSFATGLPSGRPIFVLPLLRENKTPGCPIQRVLENDFVVVTGTGTARDFIRLLTVELH